MISEKEYYTGIFRTDEKEMEGLIGVACEGGGKYADLYFENTYYTELTLRDGEVTNGGLHNDFGVGIRVLDGEKTGYAYTESVNPADRIMAARAAAAIADRGITQSSPDSNAGFGVPGMHVEMKGGMGAESANLDRISGRGVGAAIPRNSAIIQGKKAIRISRSDASTYTPQESNGGRLIRRIYNGAPNPAADRYPMVADWRNSDARILVPYLMKLQNLISGRDNRIVKILANLSAQVSDYLMFNSFGELKYDTRPMGTISVSVIYSDGRSTRNKSASKSFRMGLEMLSDRLLAELAEKVTSGIDNLFEARRPKGGTMPVVMKAGASGILLHEAMGHAFEADFNRKNQSVFSDKIGKKICSGNINIVDDGTIRGNRGSLNYDDEGVPAARTVMVEKGVLTSYLHDRISAKYYGVSPTGNGRRESFRYNPLPRMRATIMEDGDSDPQDIIASVKKGIYVEDFANGQVKIGEGDFTFYVKSGYMIENGRLTAPINDINIIGNGPEALADIVAVGNDSSVDDGGWTCGKGQSVPVSLGIPTVLISKLIVGGE